MVQARERLPRKAAPAPAFNFKPRSESDCHLAMPEPTNADPHFPIGRLDARVR